MAIIKDPDLIRGLYDYSKDLRAIIKEARREGKIKKKDYPKVAAVCEHGPMCYGHSKNCHKSIIEEINYVPQLLKRLTKFGNPPTKIKTQGKPLYVGTCAEDYAANKLLMELSDRGRIIPKLNKLHFANPIRPRTNERVKMCKVCKSLFD